MTKRYVICKTTLRELLKKFNNPTSDAWSSTKISLYDYKPDRSDMSEEQKIIQLKFKWDTQATGDIYFYKFDIDEPIKNALNELVSSKSKDDIYESMYNKVMDTDIVVSLRFEDHEGGTTSVASNTKFMLGKQDEDIEYIYDEEETRRKIDNAKIAKQSYMNTNEKHFVLLEEVSVSAQEYRIVRLHKEMIRTIKKHIKENLKYCLKKGKLIVPDEYLDKGEEGIKEWRNLKSANNKNNSMEKRLIRKAIRDKKEFCEGCTRLIERMIVEQNNSWSVPALVIDGRYNVAKTKKLVTQVLNGKNDAQVMKLEEEEMLNVFKEYWKKILSDAYKAIDKANVEEVKKYYAR